MEALDWRGKWFRILALLLPRGVHKRSNQHKASGTSLTAAHPGSFPQSVVDGAQDRNGGEGGRKNQFFFSRLLVSDNGGDGDLSDAAAAAGWQHNPCVHVQCPPPASDPTWFLMFDP